MLVFYFVVNCCSIFLCVLGIINSIRAGRLGEVLFCLLLSVLSFFLLFFTIEAIRRDNTQTVEYYFPADHYTFEQIITETNETKYIGADTVVIAKRDTIYKLVGQDPIVGGKNHFDKKYE